MSDTRVLVVEDDSIIGIDIVMRCKIFGFENTKLVFTGEAALEEMDIFDPQIYILDILLSGQMSGVDVAEKIAEEENSIVIFLTGNPQIVQSSNIVEKLNFSKVLSKPVSIPTLKKTIEEADKYLQSGT